MTGSIRAPYYASTVTIDFGRTVLTLSYMDDRDLIDALKGYFEKAYIYGNLTGQQLFQMNSVSSIMGYMSMNLGEDDFAMFSLLAVTGPEQRFLEAFQMSVNEFVLEKRRIR